jgi:phospholipid/cholesterol/gamma-HCH transport system substrate-binding protein
MAATNEQSLTFRIGVFVLASIILLAILITLFGGSGSLFRAQDTYTVLFDYAPGVGPGTPVRRSGVRIGEVQKVELDDKTGKVRVTIRIDRPHVLYQDDQPILVQGTLTGDTTINFVQRPPEKKPENNPAAAEPAHSQTEATPIQPVAFRTRSDARAGKQQGSGLRFLVAQAPPNQPLPANPPLPARSPAKPGTVFQGVSQPNFSALLQEVSRMSQPAQAAFVEAERVLERFEKLMPLMEETMRVYRELGQSANTMIPDLRRSNEELQTTARNWSRLGERLDVLVQTNQDKLIKTLDNLNDTVLRVANVFTEENQRNLAATLRNVSAGTQNLESISRNTEGLLKESRATVQRVSDSVTQADQVISNLQQATKPMAERSNAIMTNLDESAYKLNRTLTDVRELLHAVTQGDGTLRRLLFDPSLYNNLNDTVCMLARSMPRVDRILKDFEVFADKLARHPELLGVRGAVSPSAGLKEAPSSFSHWPGSNDP